MRNISQLVATLLLLVSQVRIPFLGDATAAVKVPVAEAAGSYEVKLNTASASPVQVVASPKPNYDTEVLVPLHAAQAAAAARAAQAAAAAKAARQAATAKAKAAVKTAAVVVSTGDVWEKLRLCEAGGDYTRNSGNGYYGAYQYNLGTWANYMGYARPDLAPAAVQDAKARETQAARGWYPWPACSRSLGLL